MRITLEGDLSRHGPSTSPASDYHTFLNEVESRLHSGEISQMGFDASALTVWDSRILVLISTLIDSAKKVSVSVDWSGLPTGMQTLLQLSRVVVPRGTRNKATNNRSLLELVGYNAIDLVRSMAEASQFFGEALLSLGRFIGGKARYRRSDLALFSELSGPQALPIVGLINILLGVIMAFMGAVQLRQFGAEIYVANLVALGHTREIAPMMTAIVMAGRTGAAYAAQLGAMQVNDEIDALKTFGFSPMDFLVLPRMLALISMFPVLVLYADVMGMFGGYLIATGTLGIGTVEYVEQSRLAIDMGDVCLGMVKGCVFGFIVAISGCMYGMQSGRSASAVGDATTKAVVMAIVAIIVVSSIFSVMTSLLDI